MMPRHRNGRRISLAAVLTLATLMTAGAALAADKKPNILINLGR